MLRVQLWGVMAVEVDGVPVSLPTSERARALLAWLALHPGSHPRSVVAGALWPEGAPDTARANLRTAIWALRSADPRLASHVLATRTSLALSEADTDLGDEGSLVAAEGELLPGFDDEWVVEARVAAHEERARAYRDRSEQAAAQGDPIGALDWAARLGRLRPLDEAAHRTLVERLLAVGERARAVEAGKEFVERLREQLGVSPSPATRAVHARAAGVGAAPLAAGAPQRPAVFGRSTEIHTLVDQWRQAADGRGRVVVLTGEAGIGKSTILEELVRRTTARGARAASAVGVDVAGETPFAAWLQLARSLVPQLRAASLRSTWPAELNRLSAGLGARLGHPEQPAAATAPELERLRVFEALLRLVELSCADRPLLVTLDDAHRADRASLRLTAYVGRRLPTLPVLLVLTCRDGVRRPELATLLADLAASGLPVDTVPVGPIGEADMQALVSSLRTVQGDQLAEVVSAAEGNPLLAVETTRALAAGSTGPPPTLRAAVSATVARLDAGMMALVGLVAAAGRPLAVEELQRLQGPVGPDVVTASEGLLVRRDGRVGFRHELLRAAVEAGLDDPEGLHDLLADGIDTDLHVERAHHLALAGRLRESAGELVAAAAMAAAVGAVDDATGLLQRAVEADPSDGRAWLELAEVLAWSHRNEEMELAWEQALRLLPPAELPAAWCRRGRQFRTVTCDPAESRRSYLQARATATTSLEPGIRAETLIGLAWGEAVAGDGTACAAMLAEASAIADLGPQARGDMLEMRLLGLIRQGRFAEAAALAEDRDDPDVRNIERFPDRGFSILVNAACARLCNGEPEAALVLVERAAAATASVPSLILQVLAARAQVHARLGRHDEAAEDVAQVQAWTDRLGDPVMASMTLHDRGLLALRAGRYAEAADLLGRALADGSGFSRVGAGLARAEALARLGDAVAAKRVLRSALLEPVGRADQAWALVPRVAWVQALVAAASGDEQEWRRRLEESVAGWRRVTGAVDASGDSYVGNLVDLGRPPLMGLVEPARELAAIERELAEGGPARSAVRATTEGG